MLIHLLTSEKKRDRQTPLFLALRLVSFHFYSATAHTSFIHPLKKKKKKRKTYSRDERTQQLAVTTDRNSDAKSAVALTPGCVSSRHGDGRHIPGRPPPPLRPHRALHIGACFSQDANSILKHNSKLQKNIHYRHFDGFDKSENAAGSRTTCQPRD